MQLLPRPPMVIVIVGMPGSGKTTLMKSLVSSPDYADFCFVDDVFAGSGAKLKQFRQAQKNNQSIVVSDIDFCKTGRLNDFVKGLDAEIWYFSNEPEACKRNVIRRDSKSVAIQLKLIDGYTKVYNPINPRPVWQE